MLFGETVNSVKQWYRTLVHKYAPRPRRPYEYPVNYYYAHRVDPVLSWIVDYVGLSPNSATILSLTAGLLSAMSMLNEYYIVAALFIQLHHLLDGVDGNLARAHNRCSDFGKRFDQFSDISVRLVLFSSLAYVSDVSAWLVWWMLATLIIDLILVHGLIIPFSRRHVLVRDRWKQWFLDRGLMPAFDIFTIYFIVSICLVFASPEIAVILTATLKTIDWLYRLYECFITWLKTVNA